MRPQWLLQGAIYLLRLALTESRDECHEGGGRGWSQRTRRRRHPDGGEDAKAADGQLTHTDRQRRDASAAGFGRAASAPCMQNDYWHGCDALRGPGGRERLFGWAGGAKQAPRGTMWARQLAGQMNERASERASQHALWMNALRTDEAALHACMHAGNAGSLTYMGTACMLALPAESPVSMCACMHARPLADALMHDVVKSMRRAA